MKGGPGRRLREGVARSLAPSEALYVATDAADVAVFDPIRHAGHRVVLLGDAVRAATRARRNATGSMTAAEAAAIARAAPNEYGLVDVLVAAQGRTFTGTWFSTLSTHVQRVRGYCGRPDDSTFFTMATRWAAAQAWEEPRRPWYMREFPTAWRAIDGDDDAGPRRGERVWNGQKDGVDYQQVGYPADRVADPRSRPFPRAA